MLIIFVHIVTGAGPGIQRERTPSDFRVRCCDRPPSHACCTDVSPCQRWDRRRYIVSGPMTLRITCRNCDTFILRGTIECLVIFCCGSRFGSVSGSIITPTMIRGLSSTSFCLRLCSRRCRYLHLLFYPLKRWHFQNL